MSWNESIDAALDQAQADLKWAGRRSSIRGLVARAAPKLGLSGEHVNSTLGKVSPKARLAWTNKMEAAEVLRRMLEELT